ncbi:hypothetical protein GCM10023220_25110 [Streptomyces ziwulingensis]|uniref:Uncharacterized protein n=1 Tax=Streptomyces ziwulingensis TaxID=1045501 RepID=A0ABP9BLB1_9ACTN
MNHPSKHLTAHESALSGPEPSPQDVPVEPQTGPDGLWWELCGGVLENGWIVFRLQDTEPHGPCPPGQCWMCDAFGVA